LKYSIFFVILSLIVFSKPSYSAEGEKQQEAAPIKYETLYPVKIPKFENRHFTTGNLYFNRGLYKQAYNEYYITIRLNPTFWQGYRGIANVFFVTGNINEALKYYLRAIDLVNPSYAARMLRSAKTDINTGDVMLGISKLQKILKIDPKAGALVDEGVKLLADNKAKDAQKKFEEAIKIDSKYSVAYYKLGNLLYENKKYPEAMGYFQEALKYEKGESVYYYAFANASYKVALKNKKQIDMAILRTAIANYRVALLLYPRDYDSMFNLSIAIIDDVSRTSVIVNADKTTTPNREAMSNSKDLKQAIALLERYTENKPMDAEARVYLGRAYALWSKRPVQFLKGVEEYRKAIDLEPSRKELYYDIGIIYYIASTIYPASEDLPITPETSKYYMKFGKKYYRGDMLASAKDSFNSYLLYNLGGKQRSLAQKYIALIDKQMLTLGFKPPDKGKGY